MFNTQKLHIVMAGSGNPYRVMTDQRKQIVRALHESVDLAAIQEKLLLTDAALHDELTALVEASLVAQVDGVYQPRFFVADQDETNRVVEHAAGVGDHLYQRLLADWDDLAAAFAQLMLSKQHTLREVGFLLVGANILDIGLLECLAHDGSLLLRAPHRPSPGYPEAHYYFWMIEGEPVHTGKYGQNTLALPYQDWCLFTFGQYHIGQHLNMERRTLEKHVLEDAGQQDTTPRRLSEFHALPLMNAPDIACWSLVVTREARRLMSVYADYQASIRELHASLRGGRAAAETFGEFFCWYDHLAYSHAIDRLEQAGLIAIPEERFMGALWEGNSGPAFFASLDDA